MDESPSPHVVSRAWAIRSLREFLMTLTDEDHSMCRVATDRGIFCQGFRKLNDADLQKHFAGLVERRAARAGCLRDPPGHVHAARLCRLKRR
jgi:hypothetical protein